VQWDPLPSTKGRSPIPAHIVNKVIDNVKEDKATGVDDTSITLWKSTELGRQALVALVQMMWRFECSPDSVLMMLVVFAHKPGRGWQRRKDFRPITLMCDITKVLDGCLYHVSARASGTIGTSADAAA
jgi:hypothetical protein